EKTELKIALKENQLVVNYYDAAFPLNLKACNLLLKRIKSNNAIAEIIKQIDALASNEDADTYTKQYDEIRLQFASIVQDKVHGKPDHEALKAANNAPDRLRQILDEQHYRLCFWQETDHTINYRRFFTVNGLICLNIQNDAVFDVYHEYIAELVKKG